MTYFDPQTYNYKNLQGEDKVFMDGYNFCIEQVDTAFGNLIEAGKYSQGTPTLNRVIAEIQNELYEEVIYWIKQHRVQITAYIMDSDEKYWEREDEGNDEDGDEGDSKQDANKQNE